jgi:hypothetical protein
MTNKRKELAVEFVVPHAETDVEAAWDIEIQRRLRAVKEGQVKGIPYEGVLARVDRLRK